MGRHRYQRWGDGGGWGQWAPYVPVAQRRQNAAREVAALAKRGAKVMPVVAGRTIVDTFWGKAWCENLEAYSDFANRLPRGRRYVRNGSVVHLEIGEGVVEALVQGSAMYRVRIEVSPVDAPRWKAIRAACLGRIGSVVELLRGQVSGDVMGVIARREAGLFPTPKHIAMTCSCPDWATMCKHVAAVLYGVGTRLDSEPDLLFRLRRADATELVAEAASAGALGRGRSEPARVLRDDLASVFGIDIEPAPRTGRAASASTARASAAPATPGAAGRQPEAPATAAPARGRRTAPPRQVTRADLVALGVPSSTIASWLRTGALERTAARGVYRQTARAAERLRRFRRGH